MFDFYKLGLGCLWTKNLRSFVVEKIRLMGRLLARSMWLIQVGLRPSAREGYFDKFSIETQSKQSSTLLHVWNISLSLLVNLLSNFKQLSIDARSRRKVQGRPKEFKLSLALLKCLRFVLFSLDQYASFESTFYAVKTLFNRWTANKSRNNHKHKKFRLNLSASERRKDNKKVPATKEGTSEKLSRVVHH